MQSIIRAQIQKQPDGENEEQDKSLNFLNSLRKDNEIHKFNSKNKIHDIKDKDDIKNKDQDDEEMQKQIDNTKDVDDLIGIIDDLNEKPKLEKKKSSNNNNKFLSRLKSSVSIQNDYFSEDLRDKDGHCQEVESLVEPELFYNVEEYKIDFSYGRFIYVLFLHLIYYIVLGPFSILIFAFKPGIILMRNFQLVPSMQMAFFMQTMIWMFNMANIVSFIVLDVSNIYFVEILYMNILIFLRCAVIAAKYASIHPMKWKLYNKRILKPEFTQYDFYLADWVKQNYKTIYTETYHALRRGEYDYSIFYLDFFINPKKQTIDITNKHIEECHKHHTNINDIFQPPCMFKDMIDPQSVSIYGYGVVSEIVKDFMEKHSQKGYVKYLFLIGIIRGFLTLIYRLIVQENLDLSAIEVIQLVFIIFTTFFNCVSLYAFLFYYLRDLKQKHYCQEQCTILLDLKRQYKADAPKLFPTIDITNPYALKSWSVLRRVLFDYGKSFDIRMQAYFQLNMFIFIMMVVVFILWFFGVYGFPTEYVVVSVYEILVYFIFLSLILLRGAFINQQFEINLNIIADLKVMAIDLYRLKKSYFIDQKVPANMILRRAVQKILDELQSKKCELNEEVVGKKIQTIQDSMEDCQKELQVDEINRPFKFFYIKVTLALVQTIGAGFITLIGAMVQYKLLN